VPKIEGDVIYTPRAVPNDPRDVMNILGGVLEWGGAFGRLKGAFRTPSATFGSPVIQ